MIAEGNDDKGGDIDRTEGRRQTREGVRCQSREVRIAEGDDDRGGDIDRTEER